MNKQFFVRWQGLMWMPAGVALHEWEKGRCSLAMALSYFVVVSGLSLAIMALVRLVGRRLFWGAGEVMSDREPTKQPEPVPTCGICGATIRGPYDHDAECPNWGTLRREG